MAVTAPNTAQVRPEGDLWISRQASTLSRAPKSPGTIHKFGNQLHSDCRTPRMDSVEMIW